MCHTELLYGIGDIGFYTIKDSLLQQPLEHLISPSWLPPTDRHTTGSLHTSKPNKVAQVEIISTVAVPPVPSFINPLDQGMSSRVRAGVHTRTVSSTCMGHTRRSGYGVAAESTGEKITRSIVTVHCEVGEGSKTEGLVYFSYSPSPLYPFSNSLSRSLRHWFLFQAFVPLVLNHALFIILMSRDIAPCPFVMLSFCYWLTLESCDFFRVYIYLPSVH